MKTIILPIKILGLFIFINIVSNVRVNAQSISLNNSPIEDQFQYVYQKSSDYEDFKMVKRWYLTSLKAHVLDSLQEKQNQIIEARSQIALKNHAVDSLRALINATTANLNSAIKEKNSLSFMGIPMQKAGYNSIVWSVISILVFSLLIFIFMYKRSHRVIISTETDLNEIRAEFEAFRKRALEREEGIVRKYHNELMKYKSKVSKV